MRKYIKQEWYLEEPELYEEELGESSEGLGCEKEDVGIIIYDEEPELCEKIMSENEGLWGNCVNGFYGIYNEGGGIAIFYNLKDKKDEQF